MARLVELPNAERGGKRVFINPDFVVRVQEWMPGRASFVFDSDSRCHSIDMPAEQVVERLKRPELAATAGLGRDSRCPGECNNGTPEATTFTFQLEDSSDCGPLEHVRVAWDAPGATPVYDILRLNHETHARSGFLLREMHMSNWLYLKLLKNAELIRLSGGDPRQEPFPAPPAFEDEIRFKAIPWIVIHVDVNGFLEQGIVVLIGRRQRAQAYEERQLCIRVC